MKRFGFLSMVGALTAAFLVAGCDDLGDSTGPRLEPGPMVVTSTSGHRYVVAYERNPESGSVSATIGPEGGVLGMGRHAVWVSPGAVAEPTLFTIDRAPEAALRVELSAGENNEIGAAGFDAPVMLTLSLGDATNSSWRTRKNAKIAYFLNDDTVELLDSQVYGSLVVAKLDHFSMYGIAWP